MGHFKVNFISYVFNRAVEIDVILPTMAAPEMHYELPEYDEETKTAKYANSHAVKEPYPVLYLLHGGLNNYTTWERYTSIERYAEERRIAVVVFSGENKGFGNYVHDENSKAMLGNRENFYDFARYELPDFLSANFPISRDPQRTYMAGLSMGGGGTMMHAFSHPEDFRAVGMLSIATDKPVEGVEKDGAFGKPNPEFDTALLLQKAVAEGKKLPAIYTACGQDDWLYPRWQGFIQWLDELGVEYTKDELPGYGHVWEFWDIQIKKFLDWIPRDDWYYLDNPKRGL